MRLRLGHPRSALIVAPHPDDEVIGAGHLIVALRRRGTRLRVVIVSDGGASHPGSVRWPRARLAAERLRESRLALRRLGVPAGAIEWLGLRDGELTAAACRARLTRVLAREPGALVVGPVADDAHPDHRAVAEALARVSRGRRCLGYRVWPSHRTRGGRGLMLAGNAGHAAKASLIRCHRTQMGAIRDDPAGFSIARHELAVFAHPIERFEERRR